MKNEGCGTNLNRKSDNRRGWKNEEGSFVPDHVVCIFIVDSSGSCRIKKKCSNSLGEGKNRKFSTQKKKKKKKKKKEERRKKEER